MMERMVHVVIIKIQGLNGAVQRFKKINREYKYNLCMYPVNTLKAACYFLRQVLVIKLHVFFLGYVITKFK